LGAACGLDLAGLGEAADGGVDAASPESGTTTEGSATGDDTGPGPDGAHESGADATTDAQGQDAPGVDAPGQDAPAESAGDESPVGCTGVLCNGSCLAGPDCQACPGAPLLCAATRTCGSDCSGCSTGPIECFACDTTRRNPIGTCRPDDTNAYCLDTNYAGAYGGTDGTHCACTFATDCPGNDQVCIGVGGPPTVMACFTCGEAYTQGATCHTGGKCNEPQASCH
jgi:hypothetical protein